MRGVDDVSVTPAGRGRLILPFVVLVLLAAWGAHHVWTVALSATGRGSELAVVFALTFVLLAGQTVLYYVERPHVTTVAQQRVLDDMDVTVVVPVFNEDPDLLWRCLGSILSQRRRPNHVFVVDDGSIVGYDDVRREFHRRAGLLNVRVSWLRTDNQGKRHAQGEVFRRTGTTDVYVTVDSDAWLPVDSIYELLKPLADERVQSVAGVVLASNVRRNLLTRVTDLWFVTGQLVDRSSQSALGSVMVNAGVLAAYRASLVRDFVDVYLNETFFGRPVEFSDDSLLTLFALTRGRTVQQPTAFALTAMPISVRHHLRQFTRWMRGSFIRSWWRFRYLPLGRFAFWNHVARWLQVALSSTLFVYLFVVRPVVVGEFSTWLVVVPIAIMYAQALRYLSFRRSDESRWSQFATFALAPLATFWMFVVLRPVRWYGIATCLRTGSWGTRQRGVEVAA